MLLIRVIVRIIITYKPESQVPSGISIKENGRIFQAGQGTTWFGGVSVSVILITGSFSASLSLAIWPFSDLFPPLDFNHLSRMSP